VDSGDAFLLCFGHRSRKAARAVTRALNQRLRPLDLQITQFILLGAVARQGDRSIASLAEEVCVEPSALLRNLKVLEDRGLVASLGGRGRAGRKLHLTASGQALVQHAMPIWRRAQDDLAAALGAEAQQTREALVRLERAALRLETPIG
jgi:DNA-binding MarR family transcriptional regulator